MEVSVYFPVLDEGDARVFIRGPKLPLHPKLRVQSGVKDKLSKISFIYQVLKVSSKGSIVHCEVAPPFVEGTVVPSSRPFRVRWERSDQMPDLWLVLDRIDDIINGHSERDEVKLCFIPLARFGENYRP